MTRRVPLAFSIALAAAPFLAAQSAPPVFEVASIRQNTLGSPGKKPGDPPRPAGTGGVIGPHGDQWSARNVTVRTLIRFAYADNDGDPLTPAVALEDDRIAGGPEWIASDAYDIVATMPAGPRASGDSVLMLRALLAERFALKVHAEVREQPVYALMRARRDGLWGDAMRRTSGQCVRRGARLERTQVLCGVRGGFMGLMATDVTMPQLASALSPLVGRPVVDRTGLIEGFDFQLRFSTDPPDANSRFPSIFTALQEQLGLTLEATRAPVEVLVIDRVERPTGN